MSAKSDSGAIESECTDELVRHILDATEKNANSGLKFPVVSSTQ